MRKQCFANAPKCGSQGETLKWHLIQAVNFIMSLSQEIPLRAQATGQGFHGHRDTKKETPCITFLLLCLHA